MEKLFLAITGFVPLAMGIAIFVLIWVVIFETLKKAPFFKSQAVNAIMATCVSLLSVISIFRCLGTVDGTHNLVGKTGGDGAFLDFILLGYGALGLTIILLLLILLVHKFLGSSKSKKLSRYTERNTESTLHFNLGKSDRPAQKNFTEAFQEIEVDQDLSKTLEPIYKPLENDVRQSDVRKVTKSNRIKQ